MDNLNLTYGFNRNLSVLNGSSVFATSALNSSSVIMKFLFTAEEDTTITSLGFRYSLRTGTPPTYKISLRTWNPTGLGTILGGASPASATFTPPATTAWNNTWQFITLDNTYTCFKGQKMMIVIEYSSGTIDVSNFSTFNTGQNAIAYSSEQIFPYYSGNSASSVGSSIYPMFAYKSSTKTYGYPLLNISNVTQSASITRIATRFNVPTGVISSYKVGGIKFQYSAIDATGDTYKVALWNSSSELQSVILDSDNKGGSTNRGNITYYFSTSSLQSLTPGTDYYIGLEFISGSFMSVPTYTFTSSQDRLAVSRADLCSATYTSPNWTADTLSHALIYPIITSIS